MAKKHHHRTQHQRAAHCQMDAVEHGLLRRGGGGQFLADIGRADEKCRANRAGNRVDGGQNRRAVGIEFFGNAFKPWVSPVTQAETDTAISVNMASAS